MTNEQLYLAVGLLVVLNLLFNGFMFLALNARMKDRFDEVKWCAELHRVEEVLDAQLKHLEER